MDGAQFAQLVDLLNGLDARVLEVGLGVASWLRGCFVVGGCCVFGQFALLAYLVVSHASARGGGRDVP